MARKGGKRGSSASRSAAAKKGWETRRRGGAKVKPAATKRTTASKAKPTAKRGGMPKTTSARGRALTNQRRAADLVRAGRGGKGPSAKALRSVLTAQRARAFYATTGGGKKRSAVRAKSAVKIGKQIRAEGRAKATAARARLAGRPRSRPVPKPVAQRPAAKIKLTMAELSSRMLGEAPRMSKGRGGMPVTGDTSAKASRRRNARQSQADFRSYLRTTAIATARARGLKGPISSAELDKLFVGAFKNRPRYSTKQGTRPNWRRRHYDILKP